MLWTQRCCFLDSVSHKFHFYIVTARFTGIQKHKMERDPPLWSNRSDVVIVKNLYFKAIKREYTAHDNKALTHKSDKWIIWRVLIIIVALMSKDLTRGTDITTFHFHRCHWWEEGSGFGSGVSLDLPAQWKHHENVKFKCTLWHIYFDCIVALCLSD